MKIKNNRNNRQFAIIGLGRFGSNMAKAVSYTHLDVYKRQIYTSNIFCNELHILSII